LSGIVYHPPMYWITEIEDLHGFFEAWFLGKETSMDRAEKAFDEEFTFAGPDGTERDRRSMIQMLTEGRAHTTDLRITTTDHRLIVDTDDAVVATYVEHHQMGAAQNRRLSTVVFVPEQSAPNGLRWLRVQETWLPNLSGDTTGYAEAIDGIRVGSTE